MSAPEQSRTEADAASLHLMHGVLSWVQLHVNQNPEDKKRLALYLSDERVYDIMQCLGEELKGAEILAGRLAAETELELVERKLAAEG